MQGLWDQLTGTRAQHVPVGFFVEDAAHETAWGEILDDGQRAAASLRKRGIERGARVGVVLANTREAVAALLGIWFAGGVAVSLPGRAPTLSNDQYVTTVETLGERVGVALLVAEPSVAEILSEPLSVDVVGWGSLLDGGERMAPDPPGDDDVAFIQCTSGTTSVPKGVMLTPRAIAVHNEFGDEVIAPPDDSHRMMSWAPLSHNMGLFGALLWPVTRGVPTLLSSPPRFAFSPATWLDDIVDWDATITVGPTLGLAMAVAHAGRRPPRGELGRVARWLVGAERIDWGILDGARQVLGPYGFRFEALAPAYGMAEATTAVSATRIGEEPYRVSLDGAKLAEQVLEEVSPDAPGATDIVCVGRPPQHVGVRVEDPSRISQVIVSSPALSVGYYNDRDLTEEKFRDGELITGDLGFMKDDDLFVVGREDDMVSVAGRKVYARDVEVAIGGLGGTFPGGCSIVDVGTEHGTRIVLLLETDGSADGHELARSAGRIAAQAAGIPINECLLVEPGSLPRTSTGKIQRFRCRHLVDELPATMRVRLRPSR